MSLSRAQVDQLLLPINTSRVLADGKGHSHVSQQDILAHLTRVFGFGNFDISVLAIECLFEQPSAKNAERYDVAYRALVRVTIRNEYGDYVCNYENGSTATAQNQARGDAHDLAYKSAISLSVKRACIPLGDQFGLSLYNKGQTSALVRGTLVMPGPPGYGIDSATVRDMQEGVPQQVSLGNDEIHHEDEPEPEPEKPKRRMSRTAAGDKPVTADQLTKLGACFTDLKITDRGVRLQYVQDVIGRTIETSKELTVAEASRVIEALEVDLHPPDAFPEEPA